MNISGKTVVLVNCKRSRILGRVWNEELRRASIAAFANQTTPKVVVANIEGDELLLPSKGLNWYQVSELVREGKKPQVKSIKLVGSAR